MPKVSFPNMSQLLRIGLASLAAITAMVISASHIRGGSCSTSNTCSQGPGAGQRISYFCGGSSGTYACCNDGSCITSAQGACGGGCGEGSFTCSYVDACEGTIRSYNYCCMGG